MTFDWPHELFNQFDLQWNLAHGPSLETLTDEEYLWEPVPGCWSIRPTGPGGRGEFESWPAPEPAPVTTIAWRLSHLAEVSLRRDLYRATGLLRSRTSWGCRRRARTTACVQLPGPLAVRRQIGPGVARLGVGQGLLVPIRIARSWEAEHRPLPGRGPLDDLEPL